MAESDALPRPHARDSPVNPASVRDMDPCDHPVLRPPHFPDVQPGLLRDQHAFLFTQASSAGADERVPPSSSSVIAAPVLRASSALRQRITNGQRVHTAMEAVTRSGGNSRNNLLKVRPASQCVILADSVRQEIAGLTSEPLRPARTHASPSSARNDPKGDLIGFHQVVLCHAK